MNILKAPPPPPPPVPIGVWKWTPDGNRVCSNCGMLEPDSLPGGCAIWDNEKRYCFHCGARLLMPNKL